MIPAPRPYENAIETTEEEDAVTNEWAVSGNLLCNSCWTLAPGTFCVAGAQCGLLHVCAGV